MLQALCLSRTQRRSSQLATAGNTVERPGIGTQSVPLDLARLAVKVEAASASVVRVALYAALFLVPVLIASPDAMFGYADVPKIAAVRVLAGVIAAGWIAHAAAGVVWAGRLPGLPEVFVGGRWVSVAAAGLLISALVSGLFAVSRSTAFLAAYPGFDATDVYSLSAYVITGAAAARFLRTRRQIEAALWTVAAAGAVASIYGIAQAAGVDPFHFDRYDVNQGRSPLTFGNPSFAGSYLTISLLVSVGLFFLLQRPLSRTAVLAFILVSLQLAGLGVSASRGAWAGAGFGVMVFVVLAAWGTWRSRDSLPWRRAALLVVPVAAGATLLAIGASSSDRLQSIGSVLDSGLSGRQSVWTSTFELITQRPWVEGEPSTGLLRHAFGYGPDSFRFAFQLVAPDEHVASFVPHAHNSILNVWTEQGIVGLLAWGALGVTVVVTGIAVARDRSAPAWTRLMAAAVTAAFVAHTTDQMVSVPKASDTLAMWVLVGLVIALVATRKNGASSSNPDQSQHQTSPERPSGKAMVVPPVAFVLIGAIAAVTVLGNAGHVMADSAAANLQSDMMAGARVSDIMESAGRASGLAGDSAQYHTLEAMALETAADAAQSDISLQVRLLQQALVARESAADVIPLSPVENTGYARALLAAGKTDEAVERFELGVRLSPRFWKAWLEVASAYAVAGRHDEGVAALQRAEELIGRQADVTRLDPVNVHNFDLVRAALGIERS